MELVFLLNACRVFKRYNADKDLSNFLLGEEDADECGQSMNLKKFKIWRDRFISIKNTTDRKGSGQERLKGFMREFFQHIVKKINTKFNYQIKTSEQLYNSLIELKQTDPFNIVYDGIKNEKSLEDIIKESLTGGYTSNKRSRKKKRNRSKKVGRKSSKKILRGGGLDLKCIKIKNCPDKIRIKFNTCFKKAQCKTYFSFITNEKIDLLPESLKDWGRDKKIRSLQKTPISNLNHREQSDDWWVPFIGYFNLFDNTDTDPRYDLLNPDSNYGFNLGSYLYQIVNKSSTQESIDIFKKKNIYGLRYDKLFKHVKDEKITNIQSYLKYLNKQEDEKKVKKIFDSVKKTIEQLGYDNIKTESGKKLIVIDPIGGGDKLEQYKGISENMFQDCIDEKTYTSIIDYSLHNIFKRRIFESTTTVKKNIPQVDLTDKVNNEGISAHINGKLKHTWLSSNKYFKNNIINITKYFEEIKDNITTGTDNEIILLDKNIIQYLIYGMDVEGSKVSEPPLDGYCNPIKNNHEKETFAVPEEEENTDGVRKRNVVEDLKILYESDDIKKLLLTNHFKPDQFKELEERLPGEHAEMMSNIKTMMRTLHVTMEDFKEAFNTVQSSIDLFEKDRFDHYKNTGNNPDTDPKFESKHGKDKDKK